MDAANYGFLKDKTVIFLGSSVTYGSKSGGYSFADCLEDEYGIISVKEAVSGTTLADNDSSSYISRMKTIDKSIKADAFFCQLSTNDAKKKIPLGVVSDSFDADLFDTKTVAGAIEYIISYAKNVWNCPVFFYTGTKYDSEYYEKMVELLLTIQKKHKIKILDLWNSEKMNSVSKEEYSFFMSDGVHPNINGYREWWMPEFRDFLLQNLQEE